MQAEELAGAGERQQHSAVLLKSFFNLAEAWGLSTEEQIKLLGSPARSTFFKWKKEAGLLPSDTVERISHVLSIYKALQILLPDPDAADQWVKRPNTAPLFNGVSALDRMLKGFSDLCRVRQYLDAQRGF